MHVYVIGDEDGGDIYWYGEDQRWKTDWIREQMSNFVLILNLKYLLGMQVEMLSKKLYIWSEFKGRKIRAIYKNVWVIYDRQDI